MKSSQTKVDRRKFLAGVAVAGATAASIKNANAAPTPADGGRLPARIAAVRPRDRHRNRRRGRFTGKRVMAAPAPTSWSTSSSR